MILNLPRTAAYSLELAHAKEAPDLFVRISVKGKNVVEILEQLRLKGRKPTQNAFIETFNSRLREECLSRNLFENLDYPKLFILSSRREYEERRPHSSLKGMTPKEFVESPAW